MHQTIITALTCEDKKNKCINERDSLIEENQNLTNKLETCKKGKYKCHFTITLSYRVFSSRNILNFANLWY